MCLPTTARISPKYSVSYTHLDVYKRQISDSILLIKEGVEQQYQNSQELYNNPANLFVAQFLGNPPINRQMCIRDSIILTACGPAAEPAADEPIEIVIWNTWSDHHVEACLLYTSFPG